MNSADDGFAPHIRHTRRGLRILKAAARLSSTVAFLTLASTTPPVRPSYFSHRRAALVKDDDSLDEKASYLKGVQGLLPRHR